MKDNTHLAIFFFFYHCSLLQFAIDIIAAYSDQYQSECIINQSVDGNCDKTCDNNKQQLLYLELHWSIKNLTFDNDDSSNDKHRSKNKTPIFRPMSTKSWKSLLQ